jgi:quinol monooxygenase YgiN
MIARVLWVDVGPDRIDAVVEAYRDSVRPIHLEAAGLGAHYVLADRDSGRMEIIGVWDSAASLAAVAETLEPARQRLWAAFAEAPTLSTYEVVDHVRR